AAGAALRDACREPGYDVARERLLSALNGHAEGVDGLADALAPVSPAPTLVKYAEPATYPAAARVELSALAASLLARVAPARSMPVELADPASLEEDAVTSLLYEADAGGRSYRQVQAAVAALSHAERNEVLDAALRGRGPHDEWLRALHAGQPLTFDILVDAGAFRDLHRHRRCVQLIQPFSFEHRFAPLSDVVRAGLGAAAEAALATGVDAELERELLCAGEAGKRLTATSAEAAPYLMPMGYRVR